MKGKKLVALFLASAMSLGLLAGCGPKDTDTTPTPGGDPTPTPRPAAHFEKVEFVGPK